MKYCQSLGAGKLDSVASSQCAAQLEPSNDHRDAITQLRMYSAYSFATIIVTYRMEMTDFVVVRTSTTESLPSMATVKKARCDVDPERWS